MSVIESPAYSRLRRLGDDKSGLPSWAVLTLDAMIGSGLIRADELDGKNSDELTQVARTIVRRTFCEGIPK